jgi:hypothetical protein
LYYIFGIVSESRENAQRAEFRLQALWPEVQTSRSVAQTHDVGSQHPSSVRLRVQQLSAAVPSTRSTTGSYQVTHWSRHRRRSHL